MGNEKWRRRDAGRVGVEAADASLVTDQAAAWIEVSASLVAEPDWYL